MDLVSDHLRLLLDYLRIPIKFIFVSGTKNNRNEDDRIKRQRNHFFDGEELLLLYFLRRFRSGSDLELNLKRDLNVFQNKDRSQCSRGFNGMLKYIVTNHLHLLENN